MIRNSLYTTFPVFKKEKIEVPEYLTMMMKDKSLGG